MKKRMKLTATLLSAALLCGCTPAPAPGPVFDPGTVQEAASPHMQPQELTHMESFQNAGGSTTFHVNLDMDLSMSPLPVIEAKPRTLTAQDAKDIIESLLPGASCYERHPKYTSPETNWTKAELEENLKRWRSYTYNDLAGFYDGAQNFPSVMEENGDDVPYMEYWQESLQYFEALLEQAPEEDMRTPSLWHMFKETEYMVDPEEASRMDLSQDRECIQATVEAGEHRYYYVVASGMRSGKHSSTISLSYSPHSGPASIDWQIYLTQLKSLPAPTQEQLDNARQIAQGYLDSFPIGEWILEEATPSDHDGTIYINGRPAGFPAPDLVLENPAQQESPELSIRMHPDGTLLGFQVRGSYTEYITHANSAAELPLENLVRIGLDHLKAGKTMAYGVTGEALRQFQISLGEDVTCEVSIGKAVRGFALVNTANGGLCYVPCFCLLGTPAFTGKDTGTVYTLEDLSQIPSEDIPLAAVNAIDGSIIPIIR